MTGVVPLVRSRGGRNIVAAIFGLALVPFVVLVAHATGGHDLELGGEQEPAVAVNPIDPLNVAVASWGRLHVSTDGGETFGPDVMPIAPGEYRPGGDSCLAFDRLGRLFWSYIPAILGEGPFYAFTGYDIYIAQCDPQTGEIMPGYPVNVSAQAGFPGESGYNNDKSWLTVDDSAESPFADRIYITWIRVQALYTVVSHSTDQGATWSTGVLLEGPDQRTAQMPHVATAPNGDVYVAGHMQPGFWGGNPDGVSGYVEVFRSTDGGETFPQQSLAYPPGLADITFNVQTISGKIPGAQFLTQGSTQPWILPDPLVAGRIHVVACDDPDNDVNSGDPSDIYITTSSDYGQTWDTPRRVDSGPPGTLQVMPAPAIDPASGDVVVHYYDNRDGVLNEGGNYLLDVFMARSTDGGQSFGSDAAINDLPFDPDAGARCNSGCGKTIYDVWVASQSLAFAVGASTAVLRFNGDVWTQESVGTGTHYAVWGSAEDDVFVAGRIGAIFHYDGTSWASQASGTTEPLYGLHGRSGTDVLAVGAGGTIQHFDGTTWSSMSSGTMEDLFCVWMSPGGKAYAGGVNGTLLVFDGTWTPDSLGTSERINDLWGTNDNDIYAVGSHGNIFHFDGTAWSVTRSELPYLWGVWGSSGTDVYAVGWGIVHFDGNTWSYSPFADVDLTKLHGSSQANVLVVGDGATIGRFDGTTWGKPESNPWSPATPTTRIGEYNGMAVGGGWQYAVWCGNMFDQDMKPVEQQTIFDGIRTADVPGTGPLLTGVTLEPARPNPSRGSTAFAFELPSAGHVRVSVHDAAGRTVAVLSDGPMSAGRHVASWEGLGDSGGRIRSGVYFLRLDAEGQTRMSKLVLIE